jgi:hypothetical protein
MSMFANAVTLSRRPLVTLVYTCQPKLTMPVEAPTHPAHCVAFMLLVSQAGRRVQHDTFAGVDGVCYNFTVDVEDLR